LLARSFLNDIMKLSFVFLVTSLWCNITIAQDINITAKKECVVFHQWDVPSSHLEVFLMDDNTQITVNGSFSKVANDLIFIPKFSLLQNVSYVLKTKDERFPFSLKAKHNSAPKVTAIYPTANELPENLLRMYIQFSQPMKTKGNIERVRLVDENEREIQGAIFNNVYELWDDSQTQLTIIFDPSRVKTGLIANETLGRALQPNKTFKLVIDGLEDIYGKQLEQPHSKSFSVTKADVVSPETSSWEYELPKPNSKAPLAIHFNDIIDRMSLQNRIQLFNEKNEVIKGTIHLKNEEKTWEFKPEKQWVKGNYRLKVNSRLADPSGNNLNGLFDHTIGSLKNKKEGAVIEIPFKI